MAGRAGSDEGVADLAAHHLVDGEDRAARGAQRGLERCPATSTCPRRARSGPARRGRPDRLDVVLRMDAGDRRDVARGAASRASIWNASLSSARSIARTRSGRSGWPSPMSWPKQAGCEMKSVVALLTSGFGISIVPPHLRPPFSRSVTRKSIGDNVREWLMVLG